MEMAIKFLFIKAKIIDEEASISLKCLKNFNDMYVHFIYVELGDFLRYFPSIVEHVLA